MQQLFAVAFGRMILPVPVALVHLLLSPKTFLGEVNQLAQFLSLMLDVAGIQRHDDLASSGEPVMETKKQNSVG